MELNHYFGRFFLRQEVSTTEFLAYDTQLNAEVLLTKLSVVNTMLFACYGEASVNEPNYFVPLLDSGNVSGENYYVTSNRIKNPFIADRFQNKETFYDFATQLIRAATSLHNNTIPIKRFDSTTIEIIDGRYCLNPEIIDHTATTATTINGRLAELFYQVYPASFDKARIDQLAKGEIEFGQFLNPQSDGSVPPPGNGGSNPPPPPPPPSPPPRSIWQPLALTSILAIIVFIAWQNWPSPTPPSQTKATNYQLQYETLLGKADSLVMADDKPAALLKFNEALTLKEKYSLQLPPRFLDKKKAYAQKAETLFKEFRDITPDLIDIPQTWYTLANTIQPDSVLIQHIAECKRLDR